MNGNLTSLNGDKVVEKRVNPLVRDLLTETEKKNTIKNSVQRKVAKVNKKSADISKAVDINTTT